MDLSLEKGAVSTSPSPSKKRDFMTWKRVQWIAVFLLSLSYLWIWTNDREIKESGKACEQPSPASLPSNLSRFTDAPWFAVDAAKRLAGAVKIPTMSFDDMGPIDEDPRWAPFTDMHAYLRATFPLVHATLNLTVVGGYSLVYTWPGLNTDLKPLMLTGHLDVVPALTALDRWTYPPFSGTFDDEWIYGRGAGDSKNNVIGILTAVEHLISSSWKPRRTIILAFGQDEEISGPRGANNIGKHLEERHGKYGIGMIVDEGGMNLESAYGAEFALPGIAEKGYLNAQIEVDMLGGHSSVPPQHTSIGILSKIVTAIEDSPVFQPHLETSSPIWGYLSCVAQHDGVASKKPNMKKIANKFAQMSVGNRYLLQTSKAATIFNAGIKVFYLSSRRREVSDPPFIGNITVDWTDPHEPSPISPFNISAPAWLIFSRAVQAAFGNTGAAASKNIYRWSPTRAGTKLNIHTVDEKIKIKTHVEGVKFYTELILQSDALSHVQMD
ncbi:hypothetical protein CPB84DRAFT_1792054 [Gymnopilus junonius]|uniref:Peptidase M20 dimerisation domain-containing protein n=1 Tax=Gymnopilus junonius TaxID=109634 RepID=A0A9P5NF36_GYMJU|nr:hypothetical protein CPB84DRAFT_1792054 [Gymnopilus junonius]